MFNHALVYSCLIVVIAGSEPCADLDPVECANNPSLCDDPILAKDICANSCNLCQDVTTPTSIQTTVSSRSLPTTTEKHTTKTTPTTTAKSITTTTTTKPPTILTTENSPTTTEATTKYGQMDGAWTLWSLWSHCSVTCGSGTRTRKRTCTNPSPRYGGHTCSGIDHETTSCHKATCPVYGAWTLWSLWSKCSVTCGSGTRTRNRACTNPSPRYGGHTCSGIDHETNSCHKATCPVDGGWGSWGHWGTCSVTCGVGTKLRHRSCNHPALQHGGISCVGSPTSQKHCTHKDCPITCPTDWDLHGSSCYFVSTTRRAWSYGKHYCKNHSSFLVEIDNAAEDRFILHELSIHHIVGAWTGGNYISKEGHYVWDGSGTVIHYTHWAPGQPSGNNHHRSTDNCIKAASGHWFEETCTNAHHFICEQKFNSAGTNIFG